MYAAQVEVVLLIDLSIVYELIRLLSEYSPLTLVGR